MWEVCLSFLALVGLAALGWLGLGCLLAPAGGTGAVWVLPARGDGSELEQAVRGVLWLRGGGLVGGRVLILDCGLDAEGLAIAGALAEQEPGVALCTAEELRDYIAN